MKHNKPASSSSPEKEYRELRKFIASNPPKTEEELASYIERLEDVAKGFDKNIVNAQTEIKKDAQLRIILKKMLISPNLFNKN